MKQYSDKILKAMKAAYEEEREKQKQETFAFIRNTQISICIKVSDDYDHYSLADRLEDILDDIPAIKDFIIFTK